ncbi:MAG TPA: enoyl-CoA hydratase-related protein [Desulfobacterales bacterium]|nr:enoyl-CoA hydratase-related protein [Desulfobacterales bacterium]
MAGKIASKWPMGSAPCVSAALPERMDALTIRRDDYGPPSRAIRLEEVAALRLQAEDANRVLVAVLATGPNFNTNFASLGLPVPVFGRGDSATVHVPGSDALGIVVDAGSGVKSVKVGQAVILDSWTGRNIIRGYETHDGFNAQFAVVDAERALAVPDELKTQSPERMAALLLTYGTAYRAVVERLAVAPGESVLLMGGGKGTSFAGAQIAKALGARVILMGSNAALGRALIERGIADAFIDRRRIPESVFGVIPANLSADQWLEKTASFREIVLAANHGQPVDRIFEHTGGRNFPLLVSVLAENGRLAFFGATGQGMKGEYKESFFYGGRRFVMDARWVWMRQKQVIFRNRTPREIFTEIRLPVGRNGLIWGTDGTALDFARAALERQARLAVVASRSRETAGIRDMQALGIADSQIIDRDRFVLPEEMPDPLTEAGRPNPAYGEDYMASARALGKAVWEVFGPKVSPDFIVERTDQSTLHFSTFLLRDFTEQDDMPCGFVVARGPSNLSILGSHMYRSSQARDVVRLLSRKALVMGQEDLEVTGLGGLPDIQQKMLDGKMGKPKGVALVQADRAGRSIAAFENGYLGEHLVRSDAGKKRHVDFHLAGAVGILTLCRPEALNALNSDLIRGLGEAVAELKARRGIQGRRVRGLILRGAGRAFVAGADVTEFAGSSARRIEEIALSVLRLFSEIENLKIPVIAVLDGFTLGGGNELAMSAHYRIATENAVIGQPEIKLGIIPGYGGLQRLPRLVGPLKAAEMSVNGEPIGGREALRLGLADEFAPSATALLAAYRVAEACISGRKKLPDRNWDAIAGRQTGKMNALMKAPRVREVLSTPAPGPAAARDLAAAREFAAKYVFEALAYGYKAGFKKGLKHDAKLFGEVAASPSGQEWIRRFIDKDPRQASFLTILAPG